MTLDRNLGDQKTAVERLVDPSGPLLTALERRDETDFIFHGLVHIPLAMLTGFIVSDRQAVQLFDFHPDVQAGTWQWPGVKNFPKLGVSGMPDTRVRRKGDVIMRVSISYPSGVAESRAVVPKAALQIDLGLAQPERGIVRSEEQVREYAAVFRKALDRVTAQLPGCRCIHLFHAGPVSLAFHLGQQISENIHPPVIVWNYRRGQGYNWAIDLLRACRSIRRPGDAVT